MTVEGVLGEERELFNLSQVINVDELVAAGVLPKFQYEHNRDVTWQHDLRFDALLGERLKVNVQEYGSCCVPFVMRTPEVENDTFGDKVANIYMPPSQTFSSRGDYYETMFHELSHVLIMRGKHLGNDYEQNEVAAQLSARVLAELFEHKELNLDRFSMNYVIGYGIKRLSRKGLDDTLSACTNVVLKVREAVPEIDKYDREGNPVRHHHSTLLQEYAKLRGEYLKAALPEIKQQMNLQQPQKVQQAKQVKPNEKPAGEKLQQPAPKPDHHHVPSRTGQPSANKVQAKPKAQPEVSKSRDFER